MIKLTSAENDQSAGLNMSTVYLSMSACVSQFLSDKEMAIWANDSASADKKPQMPSCSNDSDIILL